jgi:hypothetical protein
VDVSPGSEPERDDTGLPPVHVEIPDDARELDRDVQAYHREQRAQRRNRRSRRMHGLLSRDSMVVPLLICCLVFALISGTLLTLFTATSIDQGMPGNAAGPLASSPVATPAPQLGNDSVLVAGRSHQLSTLGPAVLLMVPGTCSCTKRVEQIAGLTATKGVSDYLLYTGHGLAQASRTARRYGHGMVPAADVSGQLDKGYAGLTAFVVSRHGSVVYYERLDKGGLLNDLVTEAYT